MLGARLNREGRPGRVARLRLLHALNLWWDCYDGSAWLLLSGGLHPGAAVSEAGAMSRLALDWLRERHGPEARARLQRRLLLEEVSRNTAASAANTLPLITRLGASRVGLVSDSFHIHRAHFLFRRLFSPHGIRVYPLPVGGLVRHYWRQRRYLWLGKMALREGAAWLKVLGQHTLKRGKKI